VYAPGRRTPATPSSLRANARRNSHCTPTIRFFFTKTMESRRSQSLQSTSITQVASLVEDGSVTSRAPAAILAIHREVFLKEKLSELGRRRAGLETTVAEIETTVEQIKRNAVNQEGVLASLGKFRSLYQTLPPYQQREGIRLVIANVKISEEALEISIHGRPAPEEVLEKLRAPGIHSPRRSETSIWLRTRSAARTVFSGLRAGIQPVLSP